MGWQGGVGSWGGLKRWSGETPSDIESSSSDAIPPYLQERLDAPPTEDVWHYEILNLALMMIGEGMSREETFATLRR